MTYVGCSETAVPAPGLGCSLYCMTIIGTSFGNEQYLTDFARQRHVYCIGKTGSGKTTLLENLIAQDLAAGRGLAAIDPHGDFAERLLSFIPTRRHHHLVYIDPSDLAWPIGLNPLDTIDPDRRAFVADNVVSAFRHVFAESWGPRLEYILFNALLTLQAIPGGTLFLMQRLLTDDAWRRAKLASIDDPVLMSFWYGEFDAYSPAFRAEALAPVLNKIGRLTQNAYLRNIIAQPRSTFDFARVMNEGRILIVNLAKGKIGEGPAHLLGALIASSLAQCALARAAAPAASRTPFTLYADELQAYATQSFPLILSEARKYNLHLVLSHQYLDQLPDGLSPAILGNVATLIALRLGADDARDLAPHFGLETPNALLDSLNYRGLLRTIDEEGLSNPIYLELAPPPRALHGRAEHLKANSRQRFGRARAVVDAHVRRCLAGR